MKKILLILSLLFIIVSANAQVPVDTADLRAKINAWVVTNGNKQITAVQINNLLNGITNLMTKYSVNGAYRINDTLFLTGPNLTTIKVTMSAGSGGGETDPTVPLVVKAITSTNISTWNAKQAALTPGSTIDITSNVITAKNTLPLWNANQIQGHSISTTNPTNGQAYIWNSGTSQFEPTTLTNNNIGNSDLILTGNRHLSGSGTHSLFLDSLAGLTIGNFGGRNAFTYDGNWSIILGDATLSHSGTRFLVDDASQTIQAVNHNGLLLTLNTLSTSNRDILMTQIGFGGNNLIYLPGYNSGQDTLATLNDLRTGISGAIGGGNPFSDNASLVKNNADNTKQVTIGALNVASGNNRTLQSPDANGTFVLNDNTATLTNKTLAAGSNTISGLSNSNLSGSASITNANLANSSITINGVNTALGSSTSVTDATLSTSNVTTNNVSITKHGFAPIAPNVATQFLDGTGAWSTPAGGLSLESDETYSSGSTWTQGSGKNYIQINPSSVQSTLTITTLASGGAWHNSNDLYIVAGGTLTASTPVVTTLTITAGSGMTLVQAVPPTTINAGEVIHYHKIGTFLYRIN